jgi:hypothetical protein
MRASVGLVQASVVVLEAPNSRGSCSQAWPWRAAHACHSARHDWPLNSTWPRVACGRDRCEEKVRRGARRSLFLGATARGDAMLRAA